MKNTGKRRYDDKGAIVKKCNHCLEWKVPLGNYYPRRTPNPSNKGDGFQAMCIACSRSTRIRWPHSTNRRGPNKNGRTTPIRIKRPEGVPTIHEAVVATNTDKAPKPINLGIYEHMPLLPMGCARAG